MSHARASQSPLTGRAIVIGASMAGLIAAKVLSRRFNKVTIVDRDSLPTSVEPRPGVPQGRHGHGLLASGSAALERLFPGLERELVAAGAVPGDVIGNVRWFQQGCYKAKFESGLRGILLSRPLLEGTLRRMVEALPNVTIESHTHVTELLTDDENRAITGVCTRRGNSSAILTGAALVVDASGRSSRTPEWLEQLGYQPPTESRVEVNLGYTTRLFRRKDDDLNGDRGAIIAPDPTVGRRVGFMLAQENGRWIVTLAGWLGDHAPTDARDFEEFARTLARPDIYEVITRAEPLSDAVAYAFPSNLRRHYERLTRLPERFVVIGDAVCSFNPFYGQGMSVAALEGLLLDRYLDGGLANLAPRFYREARRIIDTPWMIAAGSDFAFPGVTGTKPTGTDATNWYLQHVHRVASTDRVVCRAFFDVANLLKPATTLFSLGVVTRVVSGSLRAGATVASTKDGSVGQRQMARHA
jgi:2-polyprenyl-6-methoxyphenol hydroxylase-like FAD-dependent oxidoreductase